MVYLAGAPFPAGAIFTCPPVVVLSCGMLLPAAAAAAGVRRRVSFATVEQLTFPLAATVSPGRMVSLAVPTAPEEGCGTTPSHPKQHEQKNTACFYCVWMRVRAAVFIPPRAPAVYIAGVEGSSCV